MKTFSNVCAQGDILITRIGRLPKGTVPVEDRHDGKIIVTHSETGHHHVIDGDVVEMRRLPDSIMDCFLVVRKPAVLEHLRQVDTHESISFSPGTYHVRRQREHTPEGWRRVED